MDFKHNKFKFIYSMFLYCIIGMSIGISVNSLVSQTELSLDSLATSFIGLTIGLVIVAIMFLIYLNDYDVQLTESKLVAPSSYGFFGKRKSIELNKAFTLNKLKSDFPFLSYEVKQNKHSVTFSSKSLSRSSVEQIASELEKYLKGR